MQIQSKMQRAQWQRVIFGLVPDLVIGLLVGFASGNLVGGALLTVLGLQLLYLLLWVKNSLWTWVYFKWSDRRSMANAVADSLRSNRYPEPADAIASAEEYFASIASTETLPITLRMHAYAEAAMLRVLPNLIGPQAAWRMCIAYEDAIERHKLLFPVETLPGAPLA